MQANSTNHVYASCAHILNPSCVVLSMILGPGVLMLYTCIALSLSPLSLPVVVHFHLMRCAILSCFNFLAHLLCALVIYLLSKLCCNKILTICFISSDLHLPFPPSAFGRPLHVMMLCFFSHLLHFIRFGCVCIGFSISMLTLACTLDFFSLLSPSLFLSLSNMLGNRRSTHRHIRTCLCT